MNQFTKPKSTWSPFGKGNKKGKPRNEVFFLGVFCEKQTFIPETEGWRR